MEDIVLERTPKTPSVRFLFNENSLEISGVSIPEDADSFYAPLMEWVDEYIEQKKNQSTTIVLRLIYFNTSTSDYLVTMLRNLKKVQPDESQSYLYEDTPLESEEALQESNGLQTDQEPDEQVQQDQESESEDVGEEAMQGEEEKAHLLRIEWHYEEEDEDMRETGSHFESIIDLPFVFEACEEIE